MARHNDEMRNLDEEWQRIAATLDADGYPRRGPRDWTPEPEVIESLNPDDLPESEPLAPPSHSAGAVALASVAVIFLFFVLAGYFSVLSLPTWSVVIFGLGAFCAIAGAVFLWSPRSGNEDDDGTRI